MKTGAIIQARMSSSRLPGKVLKALPYGSSMTVLEQVIRRVQATPVDEVIVATTDSTEDNALVEVAKHCQISVFRGSLNHVLERFYLAAKQYQLDYILRVTSDCPCLDPEIVKRVMKEHFQQQADFTSSALERTFPIGQDISIFSFQHLEEAYQKATLDYEKEHVTAYFYQSHPEQFKIHVVKAPDHQRFPNIRLTLDTPEDYTFLCAVYDYLYGSYGKFNLDEIIKLLDTKPYLQQINQQVAQKKVHATLESEIKEGIYLCDKQGLHRLKILLQETLKNPKS